MVQLSIWTQKGVLKIGFTNDEAWSNAKDLAKSANQMYNWAEIITAYYEIFNGKNVQLFVTINDTKKVRVLFVLDDNNVLVRDRQGKNYVENYEDITTGITSFHFEEYPYREEVDIPEEYRDELGESITIYS